ncbi:hypothetical protein HELRODRAFT_160703 [Helobdella robusta]|uniref:Uncharacterized protein n=1 Tax=Helobdella robusta TaxID=6412 RepID=T1EQM5_HELRO|nr:hypothetical protein HELRODRAFT_160703 [Helobdella robusta]ESO06523.1 hypothetical protein HELRODRAFT_160703 [Helobdella robusta]
MNRRRSRKRMHTRPPPAPPNNGPPQQMPSKSKLATIIGMSNKTTWMHQKIHSLKFKNVNFEHLRFLYMNIQKSIKVIQDRIARERLILSRDSDLYMMRKMEPSKTFELDMRDVPSSTNNGKTGEEEKEDGKDKEEDEFDKSRPIHKSTIFCLSNRDEELKNSSVTNFLYWQK